jgi:hypothetical protein
MPSPSLIVPVTCEALVANDAVIARDSFRWWPFNYLALNHFRSPEPLALDRGIVGQTAGVYLHWTLPAALRQGVQQPSGAIDYPLVPNRWLVVRAQGTASRTLTGWIIESDCPFTSKVVNGDVSRSSQYLVDQSVLSLWSASGDPYRTAYVAPGTGVTAANIGVSFPLATQWNERAPAAMFLTAVAPANPVFSGYFPHHSNVFGFHDDLAGVDLDTLSYYVIGWYSDPTQDVVAVAADAYAALLDQLGWTVSDNDLTPPARTFYSGGTFSIAWARKPAGAIGNAPSPDPLQSIRDSGALNVGVGNTTIDAFAALVSQTVTDPGMQTLLRAFNYDLLPLLNDVNGPALLEERIRQEWFGSIPGGYRWTIAELQSTGNAAATLTAGESGWLAQLNTDQQALDDAVSTLATLQWNVHALWFKAGYLSDPTNTFPNAPQGAPDVATITAQLNASVTGTQAAALVAQIALVRSLMTRVPQAVASESSTPQSALQAGIAAFATSKSLDPTKQLKAIPSARYWRANNPVVILSGVDSPYEADPNQPVTVRVSTNVVNVIALGNSKISRVTAGAAMPVLPGLGSMPALVASLVDELLLLDPANASAIAAASGVNAAALLAAMSTPATPAYAAAAIPAAGIGTWAQPWAPLLLEWRGAYLPVPAQSSGADNWTFDGTDYTFTGTATPTQQIVGGISLLSPHAQFVFSARLQKYLATYGGQPELAHIAAQIADWKFLSQELVGFNDTLALRDARAFHRPAPSDLLPGTASSLPALLGFDSGVGAGPDALPSWLGGKVGTVPLIPNGPALPFQGIRQGQFYFSDLLIYDRFGRTLFAMSSTASSGLYDFKNFPAQLDAPLRPVHSLMPQVVSTLELPPRALQHARLSVELVDRLSDTTLVSTAAGSNPVCAWLLPDHLGNSLLIYAPDGTALGDVRLVTGMDGVTRTAEWTPPPNPTYTTIAAMSAVSPHLVDFLLSPTLATEANFTAFLSAIDSTLWTIDPVGGRADQNLSVLVGRPLALVRMRLALELDGDPIRDTGWAATLDTTTPPAYLTQKFAVRLGDQATRQDGTIGYFTGTNYATFNSVAAPDTTVPQSYVAQIGPLVTGQNYLRLSFAPGDAAFVTVLMDPRASLHATTGIVPVKQVDLPAAFVDAPLSNLEISFAMGPVMAYVQPSVAQGGETPPFPMSVTYPRPTEQNGTWAWWEATGSTWTGYEVLDATAQAAMPPVSASLREGILQLAIDLKKNT